MHSNSPCSASSSDATSPPRPTCARREPATPSHVPGPTLSWPDSSTPPAPTASTPPSTSPPTPACAGEIVGLKWCDLDAAQRRVAIRRTLQCVGGQPVEFGVKTRTSRRSIELDAGTVALLSTWRRRLQRDGLPGGIDDWMFCNTAGRYLNPQSISQLFERIVTSAEVPRVRFHDLRHTHASLLIASGEDVKVVSERLGHAHPAFTMHTYQHLLPGMSAAAADRFATMIATADR
ncbi:MAG: site-specific integrase [Microthrixaceae bacterium]|nr:site-specific integrase [Microthrixaceae bacterium]